MGRAGGGVPPAGGPRPAVPSAGRGSAPRPGRSGRCRHGLEGAPITTPKEEALCDGRLASSPRWLTAGGVAVAAARQVICMAQIAHRSGGGQDGNEVNVVLEDDIIAGQSPHTAVNEYRSSHLCGSYVDLDNCG